MVEPFLRFFGNVHEILRVDVERGVVVSGQGVTFELPDLLQQRQAIYGQRFGLPDGFAEHGLALVGGHCVIGGVQELEQDR